MSEIDEKAGWKRFQRVRVNKRTLSRRARRMETATTKHAHKFVVKKLNNIRDVRQRIIGWLLLVGALIAAVTAQMAWFQSSYQVEAAADGGLYAEAMLGPIDTLNPLYARSNAELSAARLMFSSLYDYDKTGHLRGDLATKIAVDKSKKIYTVSLRDDVRWHDGDKLTAADVVFTVNLMKNPETRAVLQPSWEAIEVKAVDEYTVQFTLPSVLAVFDQALTFPVVPRHLLEFVDPGAMRENSFSLAPVGSGPFQLSYYQANGSDGHKIVHMTAWDEYYRGAPKLSRFEIHAYETKQMIEKAVKTREVNAALDVNNTDVRSARGFDTHTYSVNSGVYAILNTQSPVLEDKEVRRAIQIGTDTVSVRASVGLTTTALDYPLLPYQVPTAELPAKPGLNKKAAAALLQKDGWKLQSDGTRKKGKTPLVLSLVAPKDPEYEAIATNLESQWKSLGFQVTKTIFDPLNTDQSFAQAVLQPRAYDVLISELAIGADPDVYAYWHSSQRGPLGRNFANYRNDIVDDSLFSARLRSEQTLRDEKYKSFVEQWIKDIPALGLYQSAFEYTQSTNVSSLGDDEVFPTIVDRYNNVSYWTAERKDVYKTP